MKKYLDADSAYAILDELFANIQKKRYKVSQKMLDETWKKWTKLPNALNLYELDTRLRDVADENMMISYQNVIDIIADESENCPHRTCKFCGKSRQEKIVFPIQFNGEKIYTCQDCLAKQEIHNIGFTYPIGEMNGKANKKLDLYVHFLNPDYFGNASYAKVSYTYENEIPRRSWEARTKVDLVASAMGMESDEIVNIVQAGEPASDFAQIKEILSAIEFCTKEEYEEKS